MYVSNKHIVSRILPSFIVLLAIYSILPFLRPGVPMSSILNNTTIWWGISSLILFVFFVSHYYFLDKRNSDNLLFVWIYLLWNVVSIIRGMFIAEMYWDWKSLVGNSLALMLPLVVFSTTNKTISQLLFKHYIKYALPLFLFIGLIIRTDAYGFYLIPISVLLIFLPALTKRQKILVLTITFIVVVSDLGARSNVIKFGVPILILIIYYIRKYISLKLLERFRLVLFLIPIVFFALGVSGIFNVFKMDEYIEGEYKSMGADAEGNREEQDLTVDTRTFLYEEVLESAINNNYWLAGRTPARGNDSKTFGILSLETTGRLERIANEIGLANVFTWTGLIGVLLYSLIFYRASYLAVNRSKNIYAKLLGIFVAFRWLYSWIEDVNNFSLNYFMLMMLIGLCFSYSFRNMSDVEVKIWIRGIFDVRYIRLQEYLQKKYNNEKNEYSSLVNLPQQEE